MEKVVIYGAGNMGRAALELLRGRCEVTGFIDGNPALWGSSISGVPVWSLSNTPEELCDAAALVAMAVCPFSSIRKSLLEFGFQRVVPAGDYVNAQYTQDEILNTWRARDLRGTPSFADEKSVLDYRAACQWFTQRTDGEQALDGSKYFPEFLNAQISRCGIMLDTAALDGGYIDSFLQRNKDGRVYSYVLTPQTVSIQSLLEKYQGRPVSFFECEAAGQDGTLNCRRIGLMRPFTQKQMYAVPVKTIDTAMEDTAFDYLRCYSMSEALPILRGGERSIHKYRPLIAVNIGHYQSDFLQVPPYLIEQCVNYKFYFRMHSYQGNDCILYAVPCEKTDGS